MKKEPYILYIEDERESIEVVGMVLYPHSYKLMGATSGKQGLVMMRQRKPDLVLLDLMMTDTNGWDVYRAMKCDDDLRDIPVIVITAKTLEDEPEIVEKLPPVDGYLLKPFDSEQLLQSVQRVLGQ